MPLAQPLVEEATKWTGDWTVEPLPGLVMVMPANAEVDETETKPKMANRGKKNFRTNNSIKTTPIIDLWLAFLHGN
jgi:hypothetical protein